MSEMSGYLNPIRNVVWINNEIYILAIVYTWHVLLVKVESK